MDNLRSHFFHAWINRELNSKSIFIIISLIIIALIVDTSIVKISAFTGGMSSAWSSIAIFTIMTIIYGLGEYLILRFIRNKTKDHSGPSDMLGIRDLNKCVSVVLYASVAIFGTIIFQMLFTSSYNIVFVAVVVWLNYGLAIVLLGFLSRRFLSWFRSNHNAVVLTFAMSIMMIAANAVFTLFYVTNQFVGANGSPIIHPLLVPVANTSMGGSMYDVFNSAYFVTSIMSFVLTWVATVLLLRSYSKKIRRGKYWLLVSIPLVYFLSQFQLFFLDVFDAFRLSEPILFGVAYTLFFTATIPSGGVLFGIAFWNVGRNINNDAVKVYMTISAYGMMLLFSSNQATGLVLVPYPPFGLATVSFFGLASYLIFVGIYSSAISVAEDSGLRRSIRSIALKESKLLDSIGIAQMEQQIQNRVIAIAKRNRDKMTEESGVESSMTDEDLKLYLEEVIKEVSEARERRQQL